MSLSKLLSLLTERKLYLCQVARLSDEFEGSVPREFRILLQLPADVQTRVLRKLGRARFSSCVSCWNGLEEESYALWQIYAGSTEGVAIRSSVSRLESLSQTIGGRLADVKYIPYDSMELSEIEPPFLWKRKAFEYEKEMRLWVHNLMPEEFDSEDLLRLPAGIYRECDPAAFIEELYVSPFAGKWYVETVKQTVAKLGYDFPVRHSSLADSAVHFFAKDTSGQLQFALPPQAPSGS